MDAEVQDEDADSQPAAEEEMTKVDGWLVLDELPVGVYLGAIAHHSTTAAVNRHLKQLLGYAAGTPDGDVDLFNPERFPDQRARDAFLQQLQETGSLVDRPLSLRRNDGSVISVEVTATVNCALIRDVSARRRLDDQTRARHQQLLQAEKLAALGQTLSGVAHELNNPLATILAWAERLADERLADERLADERLADERLADERLADERRAESPADDKLRRGLTVILQESERAARIVRNLLTFARKRQSTRAMVDLNQIVRETSSLRAYEQRVHNIELTLNLSDRLPEVFADADQVKQILLNLFLNAEQAMTAAHGRGTLMVRTRHGGERQTVVVEVEDDGPGMGDEVKGRIFDPFFTTKDVGKGTGLGLSVAYAIAEEHGGRLWVESQAGSGTSFFVELPIADPSMHSLRPEPSAVSLDVLAGRRVLVVEDEPALATAVSEALEDAGLRVDRAADGAEGLTRAIEGRYDLIVCDLKMPRLDGMQFYRAIAAAAPELARRVIFVTGAVAGTDAERFLEETGCRWLAKPFRLGDLLRAANEALA